MATKQDFTEQEWASLERSISGTGLLVSLADRDFTDTFGEVGAMAKYLSGQQVAASSELLRELAKSHHTGFGLTSSAEKVRTETLDAVKASVALLSAKKPADVEGEKELGRGVAQAVADAKGGGSSAVETQTIDAIRDALGAQPA
jgi:hypothetical protein